MKKNVSIGHDHFPPEIVTYKTWWLIFEAFKNMHFYQYRQVILMRSLTHDVDGRFFPDQTILLDEKGI